MTARCEDYPCCGHTDGLPCDWKAPDYSADPHLLCDHENGICEVDDEDVEYEVDLEVTAPGGVFVMGTGGDPEIDAQLRRIVTGYDPPEDTPTALEG